MSVTIFERPVGELSFPFGQVDSTSTSTAFTATIPGITSLHDGVAVYLKNGVVTSASGFTININGLGAKPVYQTMAAQSALTTHFNINYTGLFIYNSTRVSGGCWDFYFGYYSDSNSVGYNLRFGANFGKMAEALTRYKIVFTKADGKLLPATQESNSTGTSKTITSTPFDPSGEIYYYTTTTGVAVDAVPSSSYLYNQYSGVDLRYSFNTGSTLTAYIPIYLRCIPQSDGTFVLDGNDCAVQTLPSAEDNKVYLLLGIPYDTYRITLFYKHPVYEYKNGAIRQWPYYGAMSGATSSVAGKSGFVPAPAAGDDEKFLKGDGTWANVSSYGNEDAIAAQYDPTQTYAVGDLCFYDHVLYVCSTAISTAEEWDSTHWTVTSIDENKVPKDNPVFTGSISMGRKANTTVGANSFAVGLNATASGQGSHAEGTGTKASGNYSHAEGQGTTAAGIYSHVEGSSQTTSNASYGHAEGYATTASGANGAHSEGYTTVASGNFSHAEGYGGSSYGAKGKADHAEGYRTTANSGSTSSYYGAHAEGNQTQATSGSAHAEGSYTEATGFSTHAEGYSSKASGIYTHAEGYYTEANGSYSHVEGYHTKATESYTHAEGFYTEANGMYSHVEGYYTKANGKYQHVFGAANVAETQTSVDIGSLSDIPEFDINNEFYPNGSIVTYNGSIWVAHNNAPTRRGSPPNDTYGWTLYTDTTTGTEPEWTEQTYAAGSIVKVTTNGVAKYYITSGGIDSIYIYPASSGINGVFWHTQSGGPVYLPTNNVEIVGMGGQFSDGRNIRALDYNGNERLRGDIYVNCNPDSTGGTKIIPIPSAPVSDGTYYLQCVVASGVPTMSWVTIPAAQGVSF